MDINGWWKISINYILFISLWLLYILKEKEFYKMEFIVKIHDLKENVLNFIGVIKLFFITDGKYNISL